MTDAPIHPTDEVLREVAQQSITDGGQVIAGCYMDGRVYLALVNLDARHAFCVTHLDWHQATRVAASIIVQTEVALIRNGWDGQQAVGDVWDAVHASVAEITEDIKRQAEKAA